MAEGATEDGGRPELEVELSRSAVLSVQTWELKTGRPGPYTGVVSLPLRFSSTVVKTLPGLSRARRANSTSVGICKRELVRAKMFLLEVEVEVLVGRDRSRKRAIAKKITFSPRAVSVGNGLDGGLVRTAVLIVR